MEITGIIGCRCFKLEPSASVEPMAFFLLPLYNRDLDRHGI